MEGMLIGIVVASAVAVAGLIGMLANWIKKPDWVDAHRGQTKVVLLLAGLVLVGGGLGLAHEKLTGDSSASPPQGPTSTNNTSIPPGGQVPAPPVSGNSDRTTASSETDSGVRFAGDLSAIGMIDLDQQPPAMNARPNSADLEVTRSQVYFTGSRVKSWDIGFGDATRVECGRLLEIDPLGNEPTDFSLNSYRAFCISTGEARPGFVRFDRIDGAGRWTISIVVWEG